MYQLGFDFHAVPSTLLVEKVRVRHAVESLAIFPKASAREEGSIERLKMTLVESLQGWHTPPKQTKTQAL